MEKSGSGKLTAHVPLHGTKTPPGGSLVLATNETNNKRKGPRRGPASWDMSIVINPKKHRCDVVGPVPMPAFTSMGALPGMQMLTTSSLEDDIGLLSSLATSLALIPMSLT